MAPESLCSINLHQNHPHYVLPGGGARHADCIVATFRQRSHSRAGLGGTPTTITLNGIDREHVDLQYQELGASARLRLKNKCVQNKQTDRLGEDRKSPLLFPVCCLYPCFILFTLLLKSPSPSKLQLFGHHLLLSSHVGVNKQDVVLTWSFPAPPWFYSIFSSPLLLYQSYLLVCLEMLTVCVLTQAAALLTCVGYSCVWEMDCGGAGASAFCVLLPGRQTTRCVCVYLLICLWCCSKLVWL